MAKQKVYTVQKRSSKPGWKVKKKGGKVVAKIHKADGKVQEERTYPRGSNPSKSKG